jgi:hypothetical protein
MGEEKVMLSVIVAYVNEYPQIVFTIRAIAEELRGRVDFEIIAVNNYCAEVKAQGREQDKGADVIKAAAEGNPWLIPLEYGTKLSHWQAKNLGVHHARGDIFWFPDAHVVPSRDSLFQMYQEYSETAPWLMPRPATYHMPIGYQILEWRKLIYALVADPSIGKYFYQFQPMPDEYETFEVPVMSTCGCMMHRSIFDKLGGWPEEIGIYGGGEPFFNFSMAVLGMQKRIWPKGFLYHHGESRGYHWNHLGWMRDELIAAYCFGGEDLLWLKARNMGEDREVANDLSRSIIETPSICDHRQHIEKQQVMSIEGWVAPWLK